MDSPMQYKRITRNDAKSTRVFPSRITSNGDTHQQLIGTWKSLRRLWLDEVSGWDSINIGVHRSLHQSPRIQNSTRPLDFGAWNMVQLSTEVQLINDVCTAQSNVLYSQHQKHKKIHRHHFLCAITAKGGAFASNRGQVVRSYTCVTTCEDLRWNHCASAPHRLETHGIAERAVRRVKEGTCAESKKALRLFHCTLDSMNGGGQNLWNVIVFLQCPRSFLSWENSRNDVLKKNSVVQSYHSEQKLKIIRFQWKTRRASVNLARRYSQASYGPCSICGGKLERRPTRGRCWGITATLMRCRRKARPKCLLRRTKEVLVPKGDNFIFPSDHSSTKLAGKGSEVRPSNRIRQDNEGGEEHRCDLQGETDEPYSAEQQREHHELAAKHDFSSVSGSFIYRQHVPERQKLHVPQESSFLVPLKYIDVVKRTYTAWDVLQECQLDDYWNFDCDRMLSGDLLNSFPPNGYTRSGWRLTKIQETSTLENICPAMWSGVSKKSEQKEKQHWAEEKRDLDSARVLGGEEGKFIVSIRKAQNSMKYWKMRERSWRCIRTLQGCANYERPQGIHP